MRRQRVLDLLHQRHAELRDRFHVSSLGLFGSHARDEAKDGSDVDLLVDFDSSPNWSEFNELIDYLEDLLGTPVDLVSPATLKPRMRPHVEADLIRIA